MSRPHTNPPQSSRLPMGNRLGRLAWGLVWLVLFRPSPTVLWGWRRSLLRLFGARIGRGCHIYPSVRVWAPWNLTMDEGACLGRDVDVYSVASVKLGARSVVSQYSYLCGAGHDYERADYPLTPGAIEIGADAWVGADVFVGPGVSIGEGTVVGARSSVFGPVEAWVVAVGSPAKAIKKRELRQGA